MGIFVEMSYREILLDYIERNYEVRGYRAAIAKAGRFQQSYLNQVLSGTVNLTPDQACSLAYFFELDSFQTDYFITRVNLERAASGDLKEFLMKKIVNIRNSMNSKDATPEPLNVDLTEVLYFFSCWEAPAICAALELPGMNSLKDVSQFLEISEKRANDVFLRLKTMDFVEVLNGKWSLKENPSFKAKDFPALQQLIRNILISKFDSISELDHNSFEKVGFYTVSRKELNQFKDCVKTFTNRNVFSKTASTDSVLVGLSLNSYIYEPRCVSKHADNDAC